MGWKNPVFRKRLRYALAISAAIGLLLAGWIGYGFYRLSTERVFAAAYTRYTPVELPAASGDSLIHYYRQEQYRPLLRIFKKENAPLPGDRLLAALAYLETGAPGRAVEELDSLLQQPQVDSLRTLRETAGYYRALAQIRNGDLDLALAELNRIHTDTTHAYHGRVSKKLLRRVKWLKWR